MAETNTTAADEIDVNEANRALDLAFSIIDSLFTLDANIKDGISMLCSQSASVLLDGAMTAIADAKLAINPWMKTNCEMVDKLGRKTA